MIDLSKLVFDEAMLGTEENQIHILFTAPKEWLEDRYEDIVSTEVSFTINEYKTEKAYIDYAAISPTRYNEDEDQYEDYDWDETEIIRIIDAQNITAAQILELARKGGYKG